MGNNLTPYSMAVGREKIFFQLHILKFLKEKRLLMISC